MAILDLKEKIEPFRKNATGYVKQLLSADHVVMSDGTTLQTKMDSLNSAFTQAVHYIDYTITLQANNYVSPYKYYFNWYIPDVDIAKYGIPIQLSILGEMAVSTPCALTYEYVDNMDKYRCTIVAMSTKVIATVVFLKLN